MNQPVAYSQNSNFQLNYTIDILRRYLPLIKLKTNGANILDIGCGPGDITVRTLLPLMPENFNKLVGCDVSEEMVVHAKQQYGNDRIDFTVLNVEGDCIPSELQNQFDHVFSFWCLHWIVNQRLSFSNISRILKDDGNMLVSYVSSICYFDSVHYLFSTEKWGKHMSGFNQYVAPFLTQTNSESYFRQILLEAGFNITLLKEESYSYTFKNLDQFEMTFRVADPFLVTMDKHLHEEYMKDLLEDMFKRSVHTNDEGEVVLTCKLFIIVANK